MKILTTDTRIQTLLDQSIAGDRDALSELLVENDPELRARIAGQIGRRYQAAFSVDDVLQITYTEAFLRIREFRPAGDGAFLAWLVRIAENTLRNAVRDLNRKKRPPRDRQVGAGFGTGRPDDVHVALVETLAGSQSTPSRQVARSECKAAIESALAAMPPDYATVIRRFYLEGRPASEIAEEMGRSAGAVYMLKARAWDQLAALLGDATRFFSRPA